MKNEHMLWRIAASLPPGGRGGVETQYLLLQPRNLRPELWIKGEIEINEGR